MGVGPEDEGARKCVSLFREDDMADAFAGMEFGYALFLDPLAGALLRNGILLPDRRVVMVEHDHDLVRVINLVAAHLAEEIRCAGRAAIVEHDVVGCHIDDLTYLDALAVGVPGDNL